MEMVPESMDLIIKAVKETYQTSCDDTDSTGGWAACQRKAYLEKKKRRERKKTGGLKHIYL